MCLATQDASRLDWLRPTGGAIGARAQLGSIVPPNAAGTGHAGPPTGSAGDTEGSLFTRLWGRSYRFSPRPGNKGELGGSPVCPKEKRPFGQRRKSRCHRSGQEKKEKGKGRKEG
ncbi:homeobox protein engrailed-2 [Platysternon megacephalum]|uniref:Homeobox protein engrailed-2 n=1 Tax=Platysternon megacephalum TaxID=55544 RepID=A0A4D9EJC2_9SAUR|nr:homeobox protein engrailed-2 [Platysternon megacephalum]